ncbi:hypothetical protein D3M52_00965 [Klebsiella pneumoniae]|nr:hypothetical protein [Klebsiella pneumoniae]
MRWSLPPSRYYAEDRLSFGELSWKTLRSLVSIWVKTLSIFIARIVAGRRGPYAGTANTASVTVSCRRCWLNAE